MVAFGILEVLQFVLVGGTDTSFSLQLNLKMNLLDLVRHKGSILSLILWVLE